MIAVHDGTIHEFRDGRLDIQIRLTGPDGVRSLYFHLDNVSSSGEVKKGDVIATCGNTGAGLSDLTFTLRYSNLHVLTINN